MVVTTENQRKMRARRTDVAKQKADMAQPRCNGSRPSFLLIVRPCAAGMSRLTRVEQTGQTGGNIFSVPSVHLVHSVRLVLFPKPRHLIEM